MYYHHVLMFCLCQKLKSNSLSLQMKFFEDKKYVEENIVPTLRRVREGSIDSLLQNLVQDIQTTTQWTEEEAMQQARQYIFVNTDLPAAALSTETQQRLHVFHSMWSQTVDIANLMLAFPKKKEEKSPVPEDQRTAEENQRILQKERESLEADQKRRKDQNRKFMKDFTGQEEMTAQQEQKILKEMLSYKDLRSCVCMKVRGHENIDPDSIDAENQTERIIHDFLHHTCSNTLLAMIVFNGHGRPTCKDKGGCGKGQCDCTSNMTFNSGEQVPLNKIIYDIWKCFDAIPQHTPPYWIRIYFAQCYGDGFDEKLNSDSMRAIHLIKSKDRRKTMDFGLHHIELSDLADELRKAHTKDSVKGVLEFTPTP